MIRDLAPPSVRAGSDRRLAMVTQQFLGLVQQLAFVLRTGIPVTPPQLLQNLFPCRLPHGFVHSGHGNSYFWRNVSFHPSSPPLPGNKTFGGNSKGTARQKRDLTLQKSAAKSNGKVMPLPPHTYARWRAACFAPALLREAEPASIPAKGCSSKSGSTKGSAGTRCGLWTANPSRFFTPVSGTARPAPISAMPSCSSGPTSVPR